MFIANRRTALAMFVAGLLSCTSLAAAAQGAADWPARPLRILVTNAAGGQTDQVARVLATRLQQALGQPVVVEPVGGANGMIATTTVAQAAPDGYTLLMTHGALVQNEALRPKRSYRLEQLRTIAMVATYPIGFAVGTAAGIDSLESWIRHVKAAPSRFSYASYGQGSSGHVMGEILKRSAGIDIPHIAYKGGAPAAADLVAGHVSAAFGAMADLAVHVPGGKVKIVAVTGEARSAKYPDVPTFAEQGFAEVSLGAFTGVLAPAGVPQAVADRLTREIQQVVGSVEMRAKLDAIGYTPSGLDAQAFDAYLRADIQRWREAVKAHGIQIE